jgi:hypothetical protein
VSMSRIRIAALSQAMNCAEGRPLAGKRTRSDMKAIIRRLFVTSAVAVLATAALPDAAFAATRSVRCTNHNTQAALSIGVGGVACFQGTGASWSGRLVRVKSIWSGPYHVVAGQNGTENPIEVPPRTTYTLRTPISIDFVQLI